MAVQNLWNFAFEDGLERGQQPINSRSKSGMSTEGYTMATEPHLKATPKLNLPIGSILPAWTRYPHDGLAEGKLQEFNTKMKLPNVLQKFVGMP